MKPINRRKFIRKSIISKLRNFAEWIASGAVFGAGLYLLTNLQGPFSYHSYGYAELVMGIIFLCAGIGGIFLKIKWGILERVQRDNSKSINR